jgi:hypothetical protein
MFMKKNTIFYNFLMLFCILLFSECKKENLCDCFKSTGGDIRSERNVAPFHYIHLEGKIDLVITQDSIEHVAVVAGGHLIDKIETSVGHDTLYLRNHNICNFVRGYGRHITVYASVRYLRELLYWGAGDVSCTNTLTGLTGTDTIVGVESFEGSGNVAISVNAKASNIAIHTGPSDIRVTGSVSGFYLYNTGNGEIHTEGISANRIYMTSDCTGNTYIRSSATPASYMKVDIHGIGNVYCSGTPATLIQTQTGSGKLILQ